MKISEKKECNYSKWIAQRKERYKEEKEGMHI